MNKNGFENFLRWGKLKHKNDYRIDIIRLKKSADF